MNAGWPLAAVLFVSGAVVTFAEQHVTAAAAADDVDVVFAKVLQCAVDVAVGQCAEADEPAVILSAVEVLEIDVLVVSDVAVAVAVDAEPQAQPTAVAREHCFVGD